MGNRKTDRHKKKKKHRSSSSDSSSSSSIDEEIKKKLKKKLKKLKKKKKEKKALKKLAKEKLREEVQKEKKEPKKKSVEVGTSYDVNVDLMEKSKALAPMTKEEWEKQQNTLRRVYDEETGRTRLIKGTGEIVEECVSRDRHLAINKQATRGDGEYFQKVLGLQKD